MCVCVCVCISLCVCVSVSACRTVPTDQILRFLNIMTIIFFVSGANVTIRGCYLWDNVTIEDGCVLKNAIVCDGVTVFANTMVQERTILSWNVSPRMV